MPKGNGFIWEQFQAFTATICDKLQTERGLLWKNIKIVRGFSDWLLIWEVQQVKWKSKKEKLKYVVFNPIKQLNAMLTN